MTSSEKDLGPVRWNYNIQRYKDMQDVFFEKGLISLIFLACGRPEFTRKSFLSTVNCVMMYPDEIEFIFIENGKCEQNYEFFQQVVFPRKVVIRQSNYGINEGINQGLAISRGEYCMIHENDWQCNQMFDFFSVTKEIMQEKPDVGIVQLRAPADPSENWGYRKPEYNPWSCSQKQLDHAGIKVWQEQTKSGHFYSISKFPNGFNNNTIILRKSLYRECGPYPEPELGTDPRHGETEYAARVAKTDCSIAHIGTDLYYHIGNKTTPTI